MRTAALILLLIVPGLGVHGLCIISSNGTRPHAEER